MTGSTTAGGSSGGAMGGGMSRIARVERVTKETRVLVELDLDGAGIT